MYKLPRGITKKGDKFLVQRQLRGQRWSRVCHTEQEAFLVWAEFQAMTSPPSETPTLSREPAKGSTCWTLGQALRYTAQLPKGAGKRGGWGEGCKSGKKLIEVGQRVVDYFGEDRCISEITSPEIDAFIVHMRARHKAAGTINRHLAALGKLMTVAQAKGGGRLSFTSMAAS